MWSKAYDGFVWGRIAGPNLLGASRLLEEHRVSYRKICLFGINRIGFGLLKYMLISL